MSLRTGWVIALWMICGFGGTGRLAAVEVKPPLENKITRALETRTSAAFDKVPLADVLKSLTDAANVPLFIDHLALQDEGVQINEPVSLRFRNHRIGDALTEALEPFMLAYLVTPEWIHVTTQAIEDEHYETRVYDVSKIVAVLKPRLYSAHRPPPKVQLDGTWMNQHGGFLGNGATAVMDISPQFSWGGSSSSTGQRYFIELPARATALAAEEALLGLIADNTNCSWGNVDGVSGDGTAIEGHLVIDQPPRGQLEIFRLLTAIETMLTVAERPLQLFTHLREEQKIKLEAIDKALDGTSPRPEITLPLSVWLEQEFTTNDVRVIVDHAALKGEHVDWDDLTIQHIPDVSRRTLLRAAFRNAGLEVIPEPDRLLVTTQARADEAIITAVYDISRIPSSEMPETLFRYLPRGYSHYRGQEQPQSELGATGILVIRDTFRMHAEIRSVLEALRQSGDAVKPTAAERFTCLYALPDAQSLIDLQRLLPKLVAGPDITWPDGSVETLGLSLVVNQTEAVHRRVETIVEAIQMAATRRSPAPSPQPCDKK